MLLTPMMVDTVRDERNRGITIVPKHLYLETDKRSLTLIDLPGHRDFVNQVFYQLCSSDAVCFVSDLKRVEEVESDYFKESYLL